MPAPQSTGVVLVPITPFGYSSLLLYPCKQQVPVQVLASLQATWTSGMEFLAQSHSEPADGGSPAGAKLWAITQRSTLRRHQMDVSPSIIVSNKQEAQKAGAEKESDKVVAPIFSLAPALLLGELPGRAHSGLTTILNAGHCL